MNDLLSMLCMIVKCTKYSGKSSAAKLDFGEHTANYFFVYRIIFLKLLRI